MAIEKEKLPATRLAFKLLLFTALRKDEVLNLRWRDVSLDRLEICIPKTKSGRPHYLPMTNYVRELLENAPKTGDWIIGGEKKRKQIDTAWHRRIKITAKLKDYRIHDLRRTVASWMAEDDVSDRVIAMLLNHRIPGVTSIYARVRLKKVREALEHYSERILTVLRHAKSDLACQCQELRREGEKFGLLLFGIIAQLDL